MSRPLPYAVGVPAAFCPSCGALCEWTRRPSTMAVFFIPEAGGIAVRCGNCTWEGLLRVEWPRDEAASKAEVFATASERLSQLAEKNTPTKGRQGWTP